MCCPFHPSISIRLTATKKQKNKKSEKVTVSTGGLDHSEISSGVYQVERNVISLATTGATIRSCHTTRAIFGLDE